MNILFGSTDDGHDDFISAARAHLTEFGFRPNIRGDRKLALADDDGAIAGFACQQDCSLALLGVFFDGNPGWTASHRPIENPDATAAWLLSRYCMIGEGFLDGLEGHFAVAVHDRKQKCWIVASDPYGGRSFFLAEGERRLCFSTNLGLLARAKGRDLRVDREYEDFFLTYGFYPRGRTVFSGIFVQPAGEIRIWQDGDVRTRSIAPALVDDVKSLAADLTDENMAADRLQRLFLESMEAMLPDRGKKIGVLLGGFDSALVASAAHKLGYEVETYSFRYAEAKYNQPHTDTLADWLGIRHHWIDIDQSLIEDGLVRFAHFFNQPTNWPNYVIQTLHVVERMRVDGITHCYSGDGCDAVFMGYPGTWRRTRAMNAFPHIPVALRDALLRLAEFPAVERSLGHPYRVALGMLRAASDPVELRDFLSFRIFDRLSISQLKAGAKPAEVAGLAAELSAPHADLPPLRRGYLGKAAVSPNRSKMIASADATGVAILAPYMHPRLKAFATALPVNFLRADGDGNVSGKRILSKMAVESGLLPAEIVHQPKMAAVDAPVDAWYAGPMRKELQRIFADLPFATDRKYLDRLLDEKFAERMFKRHFMTDKVISHGVSLLATYARFAAMTKQDCAAKEWAA